MAILSINSSVVYGYVGNTVATPVLQRLGFEVWRLDTVSFSNHPAHGRFEGVVRDPAELAALVDGLDKLGVLGECEAVISGYLGSAGTGAVVADAVRRVKKANPAALYLCDPVIGDHGRVYVRDGVPEAIRDELLPLADIMTPNAFELAWLGGHPDTDAGTDEMGAARALSRRFDLATVATGLGAADEIACLVVEPDGEGKRITARRHVSPYSGTGDLFAALLLGWRIQSGDLARSTERAMAEVGQAIETTAARSRTTQPGGATCRDLAMVDLLLSLVP